MPIFEYECRECGAKFERILGHFAADVTCKQCASADVYQLLSVFAVAGPSTAGTSEPGPCGACGAPRRGMCGEA
jgi:putative FmdB family regulatory protein